MWVLLIIPVVLKTSTNTLELMPAWGSSVTSQCCHLESEASMYFDHSSSYEASVPTQAYNKLIRRRTKAVNSR